jgi:dynein heavy chain
MIPKVIRERTDESKKWLRKAISNLGKPVTNVEEFVEQNGHLTFVNENFQNVRDRVDLYGQIYNTLAEFQLKVKKEDKDNFTESVQQISQLSNIVSNVESQQEGSMETFKKTLNELIPQLNTSIHKLHEDMIDPQFLKGDANMFEILKILDEKEAQFKELENRSMKYNQWQEVLQTNPTVFEELDQLREDLQLRCIMWRSLKEWEEHQEIWIKTQFNNIQAKEIAQKADYYAKICVRLEKNLDDNPIQRRLKD